MPLRPANIDPSKFSTSKSAEQSEEGWPEYIVRNVAKAPSLTYATYRSGFGAGDALKYLQGKNVTPEAKFAQRAVLPSFEEAREEPGILGVPEYFYKEKPGDRWAEFVSGLLIPARQAGAFKSATEAGKYGLQTLKTLGGATVGSTAGRAIGGLVGGETAEDVLGLAGGLAGGLYAGSTGRRPTQLLHQVEEEAFESNKAQRLNALKERSAPIIAEREKELRDSILKYPKEKTAFETTKRNQMKSVKNEISAYRNKIKELEAERNPLYTRASELEGKLKGIPDNIIDAAKEAKRDLKKGLLPNDQSLLRHNINALNKTIKTDKLKNKTLTLSDAKELQKNFNDQLYNRDVSRSFKRKMHPIIQSLSEFIDQTGGPEHAENWRAAEEATREAKLLQRGEKEFLKIKNDELKDITKRTFPLEQQAILKEDQRFFKQQLNDIEKTHNTELNAIAKETFDDYLKNKNSKEVVTQVVDALKYYGIPSAGIGTMISAAGHILGLGSGTSHALGTLAGLGVGAGRALQKEITAANEVWARNPGLLREAGALFTKDALKNLPLLLREVNALGYKVNQESGLNQEDNKGLRSADIKPEDLEFA